MDFGLSSDQGELTALAERVLVEKATPARVGVVEGGPDRVDHALWGLLAGAGLLGIGIEEKFGGAGAGFLEVCLFLEQQGRFVAPVPLWPTLVLGASTLARFGRPQQRDQWLPAVAAGTCMLSGALNGVDPLRGMSPVTGSWDGGTLRLHGYAPSVPAAHLAARILVPVLVGGDWQLVLLDPDAEGVVRSRAVTTDRQIHEHLELTGTPVEASEVAPVTAADVGVMLDLAVSGLAAVQLGVSEQAMAMTVRHIRSRRQFGREIATFQAAALRSADAYIDTEAMRLTALQASWLLGQGLPAGAQAATAKWWAAEGGHRTIHTALHLHGGIGNDVDYPLHRYFLWSKQIGLTLGGAAQQLDRLGSLVEHLE